MTLTEKIKSEERQALLLEVSGQVKSAQEHKETVAFLKELLKTRDGPIYAVVCPDFKGFYYSFSEADENVRANSFGMNESYAVIEEFFPGISSSQRRWLYKLNGEGYDPINEGGNNGQSRIKGVCKEEAE